MKQRFRRESNLANLHNKKTKPAVAKTDIKDKIRDKAIGRKVSSSTREAMSNSSNRYRE